MLARQSSRCHGDQVATCGPGLGSVSLAELHAYTQVPTHSRHEHYTYTSLLPGTAMAAVGLTSCSNEHGISWQTGKMANFSCFGLLCLTIVPNNVAQQSSASNPRLYSNDPWQHNSDCWVRRQWKSDASDAQDLPNIPSLPATLGPREGGEIDPIPTSHPHTISPDRRGGPQYTWLVGFPGTRRDGSHSNNRKDEVGDSTCRLVGVAGLLRR